MMVPIMNATRMTDEQANKGSAEILSGFRLRIVLHRRPTATGKERHTPAKARYRRCSKITSAIGTTLDVGDKVMKNQKMEKATTGSRRRTHQATNNKPKRKAIDERTAGSRRLYDGRTS